MLLASSRLLRATAALVVFAASTSAIAGVVIVDPDAGNSQANTLTTGNVAGDRTTVVGNSIAVGASLPLTWSSAASPTTNFASATFAFSNSGLFINNINNARTGSGAAQQHARIAFQVDVLTTFTFSGTYTNTNAVDFSGRAFLQNALSDATSFTSPIPTTSVFSTSFNAGPVALNIVTQTGLLTPGHTYVWDVFVGSLASGNPTGSTGTGNLSLAFAPTPAAVPLPAAASTGLAGLTTLTLRRRR